MEEAFLEELAMFEKEWSETLARKNREYFGDRRCAFCGKRLAIAGISMMVRDSKGVDHEFCLLGDCTILGMTKIEKEAK